MFELHFRKRVSPTDACQAVATALGVGPSLVAICPDTDSLDASLPVGCVLTERAGHHPQTLTIFPATPLAPELSELHIAATIAQALNTACLVSDDSPDPFTWIQVGPEGTVTTVAVDPAGLDRDELNFVSGA